jgi:hypothetical protein
MHLEKGNGGQKKKQGRKTRRRKTGGTRRRKTGGTVEEGKQED